MPKPPEAEQRNLPVVGRRFEFEDRTAVAGDDLACKDEPAGIDLGRSGRVRRAQIVRGDDEAVGTAGPQRRQCDRAAACPPQHVARNAAQDQRRDTSALSDRHALPWLGRFFPNPFNPETSPRHHLETVRINPAGAKSSVKSGFSRRRRSIPPHQSSDSEVRKLPAVTPDANFGIKGALATYCFWCGLEFEVPISNSPRH